MALPFFATRRARLIPRALRRTHERAGVQTVQLGEPLFRDSNVFLGQHVLVRLQVGHPQFTSCSTLLDYVRSHVPAAIRIQRQRSRRDAGATNSKATEPARRRRYERRASCGVTAATGQRLFVAEGDDGVNPEGAAGGNVAGEEGDGYEEDGDGGERERVAGADGEEEAGEQPC